MALPSRDSPKRGSKRICVIGAGATGLGALKVIKDTPQYKEGLWVPVAFEARENVGGIWYVPAPATDDPPLTPLYDSMTANLPHAVMAYTSFPFPPLTPIFPHASIVEKYLISYAEHFDLMPHIRLNTAVELVERRSDQWEVKVSTGESYLFDLVMVCNGHYRIPRYPDTPGIEEWLLQGRATHSAWYRLPHNLPNTVLVLGGGPSGNDITAESLSVSRTVIHSTRGGKNEDVGRLKKRSGVSQFGDNGRVVFEDGTIESGVDHCILATGFQGSLSFLPESIVRRGIPPVMLPLPEELHDTTYGVFPLAKHIFPLRDQSLVFLGLPVRVTPFPLAEAQAHAVVHVLAHPEAFNATQEATDIITRYEQLRSKVGDDPRAITEAWDVYHIVGLEQPEYRDGLYEFAAKSSVEVKVQRWENRMSINRDPLRRVWWELEKNGEAEEWVKGVGEKGKEEWAAVLERMLDRAKEMGLHVSDVA